MINKCLYWQLTMTCYDDILCAMLKKAWTTLWCTEHFGSASLCNATGKTPFPAGGPGRLRSRALTLVGVPAAAHPIPPSAPNACERPAETLLRSDVVMNWNFNHAAAAENQHGPAQTVWPAGGCTSSQPTCLYYIVLTKSLCLTPHPPFLYSDGETLLVYVFDICTNAPLWKRKWNLDISVIIGLPVFLFTASKCLKADPKINVILLIFEFCKTV